MTTPDLRILLTSLLATCCSSQSTSRTDETVANSSQEAMLSWEDCMDRSDGKTGPMLDCIAIEHTREDQLLHSAFRRSLNGLTRRRQVELEEEQMQWATSIVRTCKNEPEQKEFEGGSAAEVFYKLCMMNETRARVLKLRERLAKANSASGR